MDGQRLDVALLLLNKLQEERALEQKEFDEQMRQKHERAITLIQEHRRLEEVKLSEQVIPKQDVQQALEQESIVQNSEVQHEQKLLLEKQSLNDQAFRPEVLQQNQLEEIRMQAQKAYDERVKPRQNIKEPDDQQVNHKQLLGEMEQTKKDILELQELKQKRLVQLKLLDENIIKLNKLMGDMDLGEENSNFKKLKQDVEKTRAQVQEEVDQLQKMQKLKLEQVKQMKHIIVDQEQMSHPLQDQNTLPELFNLEAETKKENMLEPLWKVRQQVQQCAMGQHLKIAKQRSEHELKGFMVKEVKLTEQEVLEKEKVQQQILERNNLWNQNQQAGQEKRAQGMPNQKFKNQDQQHQAGGKKKLHCDSQPGTSLAMDKRQTEDECISQESLQHKYQYFKEQCETLQAEIAIKKSSK